MKLLFIDTETTGLDPIQNAVIQIAGIVEIDGVVKEEFNLLARPFPGELYSNEALNVTGRSIEEIKGFPYPADTFRTLMGIFEKYINRYDKRDKFHMVGQNPKFDYDFLARWFVKNGNRYFYAYVQYHLIDLIVASTLFKLAGLINVPDAKLGTMSKHFGIAHDAHDALGDIKVTRELFYKYIEFMKQIKV